MKVLNFLEKFIIVFSFFLKSEKRILSENVSKVSGKKGYVWASVGGAVASYTRGPQFESIHRRVSIWNIYLLSSVLYCEDENKKNKEAGDSPFKKRNITWLNLGSQTFWFNDVAIFFAKSYTDFPYNG